MNADKTRELYLGFLGFKIDWQHHGDGSPGASILVEMTGLDQFHAELTTKKYGYGRPGIVEQTWG